MLWSNNINDNMDFRESEFSFFTFDMIRLKGVFHLWLIGNAVSFLILYFELNSTQLKKI